MKNHSITIYDLNDPRPEINRLIQMRLEFDGRWNVHYGTWNGKSFRDQNNRLRLDVVEWFYDDEHYPKPEDNVPEETRVP